MSDQFPWTSHFSIRESDIIERFRLTYLDDMLWTHKAVKLMGLDRTREEVFEYLERNPRKPKEAA